MIFFFLISFILGIGISSFLPIPFFIYPFFLLLIIFSFVLPKKKRRFLPLIIVCLIGFGLGDLRLNLAYPKIDEHHLAFYNEKEIIWQGRIIKEPEQRLDRINLIVEAIKINTSEVTGKALLSVPLYSDYQYGDILEIEGELKTPIKIENFDYPQYLAVKNIYSLAYNPKIKILERGTSNFFL